MAYILYEFYENLMIILANKSRNNNVFFSNILFYIEKNLIKVLTKFSVNIFSFSHLKIKFNSTTNFYNNDFWIDIIDKFWFFKSIFVS